MKLFYTFILFLLVALGCNNTFAQGREIKKTFNASTSSVGVGDSCFIPCEYVDYHWYGFRRTFETDSTCDSICAFLKANPTVCIAIINHTDYRPISMGNDVLTMYRANDLKNYIVEHGDIDTNRIIAIGMADRQPRIVTEEIHKEYNFLPLGQVLDMEFCKTLFSNRKNYEIAMGLNRRTVVKIIAK